jgi:uncharacterized protein (DUF302 family)
MLYERETKGTVPQVVERLSAAAMEHHFGVLGTIDLKAKMADKGVSFDTDCVVLEVCNPHQAKAVLEENMVLATALPCRIAVYEFEGDIVVATVRPTALVEFYGASETLTAVALEVENSLLSIIDEACSQ